MNLSERSQSAARIAGRGLSMNATNARADKPFRLFFSAQLDWTCS